MDSDVAGSSNPGPDEGDRHVHRHGTEDPGPHGVVPGQGSSNPGPADEPGGAGEAPRSSGNPGPEDDRPAERRVPGSENPGPEEG